jgi:cob(I)alamin adenosyltransferase
MYNKIMLYTGKGDGGTTKTFDSKPGERISKSSLITEALGALDEINSFLGFCKVRSKDLTFVVTDEGPSFEHVIHNVQQKLFIIQAELAGAPKTIEEIHVKTIEELINHIETLLPPIKTFFISGGTELAATFDFARTMARRAERRVVHVHEQGRSIGQYSLAYLNRLSSLLYALARLTNHKSGINEEPPSYS